VKGKIGAEAGAGQTEDEAAERRGKREKGRMAAKIRQGGNANGVLS
jgi:hypothetical protein